MIDCHGREVREQDRIHPVVSARGRQADETQRRGESRRESAWRQAKPSQVAPAWLLAHSPVILPIPGTAHVAHLDENVAAGCMPGVALLASAGAWAEGRSA
jgi:aryl-alcohol dehydrogenase-like predicted oxidoreductase